MTATVLVSAFSDLARTFRARILGVRGLSIPAGASTFLDAPVPFGMAHRGFDLHGRENSMRAFQAALDLGVRHLETDVHATADGVLVAFHDTTLDRVTDSRGLLSRLPWDKVSRARIAGTEPIPRLEEMLASWPEARLNLDVKHRSAIGPLVQVLRRSGAASRVCVASFSDLRRGAVVRAVGPGLATSLGLPRTTAFLAGCLPGTAGLAAARALRRVAARGAVCLQLPRSVGPLPVLTARTVQVAHEMGLQVHAWTINDRAEMERLLDLGLDALITDRADILREVLHDRARPPA